MKARFSHTSFDLTFLCRRPSTFLSFHVNDLLFYFFECFGFISCWLLHYQLTYPSPPAQSSSLNRSPGGLFAAFDLLIYYCYCCYLFVCFLTLLRVQFSQFVQNQLRVDGKLTFALRFHHFHRFQSNVIQTRLHRDSTQK